MGRVHHSFTSFISLGERRGSGIQHWHGINAQSISVHPFPPSAHFLSVSHRSRPPFGTNAETLISHSLAMILGFHVLQDFMLDELMCSSGPCAAPHYNDGRPQTSAPRLRERIGSNTSWHRLRDTELFSTADRSSFNVVGSAESHTEETTKCLLTLGSSPA